MKSERVNVAYLKVGNVSWQKEVTFRWDVDDDTGFAKKEAS